MQGTSFAAPAALRTALGVRATFGKALNPLTLKGLLIHCADDDGTENRQEIGWGVIPTDVDDVILCPEGTARVIYQGVIDPAKYIRALLPLPNQSSPV